MGIDSLLSLINEEGNHLNAGDIEYLYYLIIEIVGSRGG